MSPFGEAKPKLIKTGDVLRDLWYVMHLESPQQGTPGLADAPKPVLVKRGRPSVRL